MAFLYSVVKFFHPSWVQMTHLFLRTVYHEIESWTTENNSVELKKQIFSDNIDSRIYSVTLALSEDRIIIFEMQSK